MVSDPDVDLIIAGAGGFGREVAAYAMDAIAAGRLEAHLLGFINDTEADPTAFGCPWQVLGSIAKYRPKERDRVIVAIGDPTGRLDVIRRLEAVGARFLTVVHPLAYVATSAVVGAGSVIAPFATIGPHAVLDGHAVINTHVGIGHDCRIGRGTVISPHAVLNGWVVTGEGVLVGSAAAVMPRQTLGDGCRVASGAVVYGDIPPGKLALGNPARLTN